LAYEENATKGHDNQKLTPTLADAAKIFISCAENIRETTETIIRSCDDITDTKRVDYECTPRIKTNELKILATLYNSAAKRLKVAARKLLEGDPRDHTLTEVIVYSLFFIDQLSCEEYKAR
jgi:hypothetical protein